MKKKSGKVKNVAKTLSMASVIRIRAGLVGLKSGNVEALVLRQFLEGSQGGGGWNKWL